MFSKDRIYRFHIEPTDKCNAACPMCPRTDPMDFCRPNKEKIRKIDLTLDDFHQSFPPEFARRVARVDLCGGLGDPLAARDCLEICDYLISHGVLVTISTNGSLRSQKWWRALGEIFRTNGSFIELHVDGLRESNRYYRVNTDFDKIMANIEAYFETGAEAEWHYILFAHNEDDVHDARALASKMGFRKFVLTDTVRFGDKDYYPYRMPDGEERRLRMPRRNAADYAAEFVAADGSPPPSADKKDFPKVSINGIQCKSQIENRPYITADGQVSACCWIAGSGDEKEMGRRSGIDYENFNIRHRPLEDILLDEPFRSLYADAWRGGDNPVCIRKCGQGKRNKRIAVN